MPSLDLLTEVPPVKDTHTLSDEALEENARMLEAVLTDFGVKGRITAVRPGPVVTLYSCGITPYDSAHLGHAQVYLTFEENRGLWVRLATQL